MNLPVLLIVLGLIVGLLFHGTLGLVMILVGFLLLVLPAIQSRR